MDLKYIKQNIVLLFEGHKNNPKTKTVILIMVMSVASGKHSEHDTEPACFVLCTTFETLRHRKLQCTPWNTRTRNADAMCVRF